MQSLGRKSVKTNVCQPNINLTHQIYAQQNIVDITELATHALPGTSATNSLEFLRL